MKLIFLLLLAQAMTLMATNTEEKPDTTEFITKVTASRKPVVDLKKKIVTTTPKLPEERKKLSIFPKNPAKYIVTSKPYAKVRTYTIRPIVMKKKALMPIFKPGVTTKEPVTVRPAMRHLDSIVEWPPAVPQSRIHRRLVEEKHVNNNRGYKITQYTSSDKTNQIKDDSEEISTGLPEFAEDELTKDLDNNVEVDFNSLSELDNLRIKRLAVHGPTVHDSWYFKNVARGPIDASHELNDEDEFIFFDNKKKTPTSSALKPKSSRSMKGSTINPTSASVSRDSSRPKRSDNIIEEENIVTTASGFENTGREPRITDDLVFKNIHA